MTYEVMETIPLKTKKGTVKIKKYQFDTREEAGKFALTSSYQTQIYKKKRILSPLTKKFTDSVDDINDVRAEMARWVTGAIIATILVLVQALPTSIFVVLIGLASAGLSQVMAEVLGSLGLGIGPGARKRQS